MSGDHSITSGKIYRQLIDAERSGRYLGETVQIIPHFTDAVQEWIVRAAHLPVTGGDIPRVCLIEMGGTVGDIEGMPFIESLRQLQYHPKVESVTNVHLTLLPSINSEIKTKPAQNSVSLMRSKGLTPDILICRNESSSGLSESIFDKLCKMCGLGRDRVISLPTEKILWNVPFILHDQRVSSTLVDLLDIKPCLKNPADSVLSRWKRRLIDIDCSVWGPSKDNALLVKLVGKYTRNPDAYLSIQRALQHAAIHENQNIHIQFIDSEKETHPVDLVDANAIVIPGGFGWRGVDGMIEACKCARENLIPILGICMGFQCMVLDFARHRLLREDATSEEDENGSTDSNFIIHMPDVSRKNEAGSMRLGSHTTIIKCDSLANRLYGSERIIERHRHRYEVNPTHANDIEREGLLFTGKDTSGSRMEMCEMDAREHPFFIGCQFHPEFQSRPFRASPLFTGLISAARRNQLQKRLAVRTNSILIR